MNDRYRVLFSGDVVNGSNVEEVKDRLASLLQKDRGSIEKLFSGRLYIIKKDLDLETCEKIRRSFIAVGAVCHIQDQQSHPARRPEAKDDDTLQVIESSSPGASKFSGYPSISWREQIHRVPVLLKASISHVASLRHKTAEYWGEASESIQSDMEIGGARLLVKNKHFLALLAASLVLLAMLVFALTYERKAMPLDSENLTALVKHIEFIENAFTTEELARMTKDRDDFLDYVLVDPIRKMDYEFQASLANMAERYLDEGFREGDRKMARIYLDLAAHERAELFTHGLISQEIKEQLDRVAKKLGE